MAPHEYQPQGGARGHITPIFVSNCIAVYLTAVSQAKTGVMIQLKLGVKNEKPVSNCILLKCMLLKNK